MRTFAIRYLKILAVMSVFLVSLTGTYVAMNHKRIFPPIDQIVVYGRDSCGITSDLRQYLDEQTVPYIYANLDKPLMSYEFAAQLTLSEARAVSLPVVLVGGQVLERPAHEVVLALQKNAKEGQAHE